MTFARVQSSRAALLKLHHGFIAKPAKALGVVFFPGYPDHIPNGHLSLYTWQQVPASLITYVVQRVR